MVQSNYNMRYMLFYFTCLLFLFACQKNNPETANATYKDSVFTENFRRTSGLVAGDGGYSIPLSDNRSLWGFGDSHINYYDAATQTVPCLFQVRNAIQVMGISDPTAQQTLTGSGSIPSYFSVGSNNNYWFWPGAGYQNGDTVYVLLSRIRSTGTGGSFGFEGVDSNYVAKIKFPQLTVSGYSLLPSKNGIVFNVSVVKDGDYNYVYGIKQNGFGNGLYVARFPSANIYAAWEFYNGSAWSANAGTAAPIANEFTSSFNICRIKNKYVLITTEFSVGCDQGKNIYSAVSDNPFGPFTNKKSIWVVDDLWQGHYPFFYLANAHPEYDNGTNELLITYSINGYDNCVNTCINNRKNPDHYRLKAIRVPYKVMDAGL